MKKKEVLCIIILIFAWLAVILLLKSISLLNLKKGITIPHKEVKEAT